MPEYLEWLKEFLDNGGTIKDLSPTLTMITYNKGKNVMLWDVGYKI